MPVAAVLLPIVPTIDTIAAIIVATNDLYFLLLRLFSLVEMQSWAPTALRR